jgi:D-alanyl-D-alanine dipeptidase
MNNIKKIESKMVTYTDLLSVPTKENGEECITIDPKVIPNGYMSNFSDMEKITGKNPFVRKSVYEKLQSAQKLLSEKHPNLSLYVTYGYRSLEIQTAIFLEVLAKTNHKFFASPVDLYEEIHRFIAVPTVAGHPTGGAVDLTIRDTTTTTELDFGSKLYDFSNKLCYVFYEPLATGAIKNRALLRETMLAVGFAPFDGEWWHFSYGDREWARYYNQKFAIYDQLPVSHFKSNQEA